MAVRTTDDDHVLQCASLSETPATTTPVGVRELRQNLSVYLRRIERGERFEVTERGNPVALLISVPKDPSLLARLIAEGRVRPPNGDPRELPPPTGEPNASISETLFRDREDRL